MKKTLIASLFILAILLSACGAAASPTTSPAGTSVIPQTGSEAKVSISNFAFDPAAVTVKAGQTVVWTNQDSVAHTVVADDNSWKSPNIAQGSSFSHTFTTAGTFTYHCSIHPKMVATVIVTP